MRTFKMNMSELDNITEIIKTLGVGEKSVFKTTRGAFEIKKITLGVEEEGDN